MIYQVELSKRALGRLGGFPTQARDALVATLAVVIENPYDPLTTAPTEDPQQRWTAFGEGMGFVELYINDATGTVTVVDLTWAG